MSNTNDAIAIAPPPLQVAPGAYPFQEYSDDPNIVAFFTAYNQLAQGYLDWANQTPLSVYTSPAISGPLLDWIGQGIYGVTRPVFASIGKRFRAGLNSLPLNTVALNGNRTINLGTSGITSDDYYKRVLTWTLYLGNGRRFTIPSLRLRVARFLYGANGTDVSLSQAQNVSITLQGFKRVRGALNSHGLNLCALNGHVPGPPNPAGQMIITVPPGTSSRLFSQAFEQGVLAFPFQINAFVVIS